MVVHMADANQLPVSNVWDQEMSYSSTYSWDRKGGKSKTMSLKAHSQGNLTWPSLANLLALWQKNWCRVSTIFFSAVSEKHPSSESKPFHHWCFESTLAVDISKCSMASKCSILPGMPSTLSIEQKLRTKERDIGKKKKELSHLSYSPLFHQKEKLQVLGTESHQVMWIISTAFWLWLVKSLPKSRCVKDRSGLQ